MSVALTAICNYIISHKPNSNSGNSLSQHDYLSFRNIGEWKRFFDEFKLNSFPIYYKPYFIIPEKYDPIQLEESFAAAYRIIFSLLMSDGQLKPRVRYALAEVYGTDFLDCYATIQRTIENPIRNELWNSLSNAQLELYFCHDMISNFIVSRIQNPPESLDYSLKLNEFLADCKRRPSDFVDIGLESVLDKLDPALYKCVKCHEKNENIHQLLSHAENGEMQKLIEGLIKPISVERSDDDFVIIEEVNANLSQLNEQQINEIILFAAWSGHDTVVRYFINKPIPLDHSELSKALRLAAFLGYESIVNQLIHYGAYLEGGNDSPSALMLAVCGGQIDTLKDLLQDSQMIDTETFQTFSDFYNMPMLNAIAYGKIHIVEYLLSLEFNLNCEDRVNRKQKYTLNIEDIKKRTPTMVAAFHGRLSMLQYLLNQGCMLSSSEPDSRNAMHWAIIGGQEDIVNWLFEHENEFKLFKNDPVKHLFPRALARIHKQIKMAELLKNLEQKSSKAAERLKKCSTIEEKNQLLLKAIDEDNFDLLEEILKDHQELDLETALIHAVKNGMNTSATFIIYSNFIKYPYRIRCQHSVQLEDKKFDVEVSLLQLAAIVGEGTLFRNLLSWDGAKNKKNFYLVKSLRWAILSENYHLINDIYSKNPEALLDDTRTLEQIPKDNEKSSSLMFSLKFKKYSAIPHLLRNHPLVYHYLYKELNPGKQLCSFLNKLQTKEEILKDIDVLNLSYCDFLFPNEKCWKSFKNLISSSDYIHTIYLDNCKIDSKFINQLILLNQTRKEDNKPQIIFSLKGSELTENQAEKLPSVEKIAAPSRNDKAKEKMPLELPVRQYSGNNMTTLLSYYTTDHSNVYCGNIVYIPDFNVRGTLNDSLQHYFSKFQNQQGESSHSQQKCLMVLVDLHGKYWALICIQFRNYTLDSVYRVDYYGPAVEGVYQKLSTETKTIFGNPIELNNWEEITQQGDESYALRLIQIVKAILNNEVLINAKGNLENFKNEYAEILESHSLPDNELEHLNTIQLIPDNNEEPDVILDIADNLKSARDYICEYLLTSQYVKDKFALTYTRELGAFLRIFDEIDLERLITTLLGVAINYDYFSRDSYVSICKQLHTKIIAVFYKDASLHEQVKTALGKLQATLENPEIVPLPDNHDFFASGQQCISELAKKYALTNSDFVVHLAQTLMYALFHQLQAQTTKSIQDKITEKFGNNLLLIASAETIMHIQFEYIRQLIKEYCYPYNETQLRQNIIQNEKYNLAIPDINQLYDAVLTSNLAYIKTIMDDSNAEKANEQGETLLHHVCC